MPPPPPPPPPPPSPSGNFALSRMASKTARLDGDRLSNRRPSSDAGSAHSFASPRTGSADAERQLRNNLKAAAYGGRCARAAPTPPPVRVRRS